MHALQLFLWIPFVALPSNPGKKYSIADLGVLPGDRTSLCSDINHRGQAVGGSRHPGGGSAFLFEKGEMVSLGSLDGKTSYALQVNELGQVVGYSSPGGTDEFGGPIRHGFLWDAENGMQPLESLGGDGSAAYANNDKGQIAGSAKTGEVYYNDFGTPHFVHHAAFWDSVNQSVSDLGTLGGNNSAANDLNNAGKVIGFAELDLTDRHGLAIYHAFLWDPTDSRMKDLGTLPGNTFSEAVAINENGRIVGSCFNINEETRAFLWDPERETMTDLGALPGDSSSRAIDINSEGSIVGESWNSNERSTAVLWEDGDRIDLNQLLPPHSGWKLEASLGINNFGQIVGKGLLNGEHRGFLMTPIRCNAVLELDASCDGEKLTVRIQSRMPAGTVLHVEIDGQSYPMFVELGGDGIIQLPAEQGRRLVTLVECNGFSAEAECP